MFAHGYAGTDDAEYNYHICLETDSRFVEEPELFFPASVRPGRTDVGSESTNDLRFPYQSPSTSDSAYNTLDTLSPSGRMFAESPSTTGAMSSDGSYMLGLGGAFAYSPRTEDYSLEGMNIDCQSSPLWPSELIGLADLEGEAPQPSFGATTRCSVFADPISGFKLDLDSMDHARATGFLDNGLESPIIPEEHCWGYSTDPQYIFSMGEQSTQDSIWQGDLSASNKIESAVNQNQLSAHPAGPFEQVVVGPETCGSVLGRVKDAESTSVNARATKPFICRETGCKKGFTHSFDLQRHKRTVHMEQGAGYRCTVQGCPKADKLWTRHDSYKKHVMKRHSDANLNDLVKKFNRSQPDSDARFPFSVTTPTMIKQQKARSHHQLESKIGSDQAKFHPP